MSDSPADKPALDLASIVVCTLAWGTTWYAITLQLGVVDPVISIVYRFGLAAAVLFGWCALRGERLGLTAPQHAAAAGVGFFTFSINYPLVYWAEGRVASAVVAVIFAALAFVNLVAFRLVFKQRAPALAWAAALLGMVGVGVLFWSELADAHIGRAAALGMAAAFLGVVASVVGNLFARRGEIAGAPVAAATAWGMLYGSAMLAAFALLTGRTWAFEWTWSYGLSLVYLALVGSVIAFALYFGLARRRGYGAASYISALTPPVAMLMSTLFEGKGWSAFALAGVALVLFGQWLLLRTRRT